MESLKILNNILAYPLIGLVAIYQKTLSPDHGWFKHRHPYGFCRMYPTCSEYARISLVNDGVISLPKIILRIIKCNPLTKPSVDLP